jgi:sugar lactone lactonase YvrE
LYIADTANHRVRRVSPGGTIATGAGTGVRGFAGDGGPAVNAMLAQPAQVMPDGGGRLYVADYGNGRVRRIAPDGTISTVAGNGDVANDGVPFPPVPEGGPALHAFAGVASAVALDGSGNLYVADMQESRLRKIAPDGTVTTVAGTGVSGTTGDGGPAAKAGLGLPWGLATDTRGSVYIAQADSRIRRIDANGIITTFAGTGTGTGLNRAQGDGGPASMATLNEAKGIAVDAAGNVYLADTSNARVRKVDTNGVIQTVAGPGEQGVDYWNAVAIAPSGGVLVATTHAAANSLYSRVQRINPDGSLTPVAGNGAPCVAPPGEFAYDGMQALQAPLCVVMGLTYDPHGTLYISDPYYGVVLAMTADGAIRRAAGSFLASALGDMGPALSANLVGGGAYFTPAQIAVDAAGDLFVGQAGAYRVRELTGMAPAVTVSRDAVDVSGGQAQAVAVGITIGAPVAYLVQIPTDAGWLTVNRASGITGETVTFAGDASGLAAGVYKAAVTVTVPSAAPLQAAVTVTMTVK